MDERFCVIQFVVVLERVPIVIQDKWDRRTDWGWRIEAWTDEVLPCSKLQVYPHFKSSHVTMDDRHTRQIEQIEQIEQILEQRSFRSLFRWLCCLIKIWDLRPQYSVRRVSLVSLFLSFVVFLIVVFWIVVLGGRRLIVLLPCGTSWDFLVLPMELFSFSTTSLPFLCFYSCISFSKRYCDYYENIGLWQERSCFCFRCAITTAPIVSLGDRHPSSADWKGGSFF